METHWVKEMAERKLSETNVINIKSNANGKCRTYRHRYMHTQIHIGI